MKLNHAWYRKQRKHLTDAKTRHRRKHRNSGSQAAYQPPSDAELAAMLNAKGLCSPKGNPWTAVSIHDLRNWKDPFPPATLLDEYREGASLENIARYHAAKDVHGLSREFFGEVHLWVRDCRKIYKCGYLASDAISEAHLALQIAARRVIHRDMTPQHIRNSLKKFVKGSVFQFLANSPLVGPNLFTLQDRREKERKGGDPNRPASDRRPADGLSRLEGTMAWDGRYSYDPKRTHAQYPSVEDEGLQQEYVAPDPCIKTEYWYFVLTVCRQAIRQAKCSKLKKAIRLLLAPKRNEAKRQWYLQSITATAQAVGWTERKLRLEMIALAFRVARHLPPPVLQYAKVYLKEHWQRIEHIAARPLLDTDRETIFICRQFMIDALASDRVVKDGLENLNSRERKSAPLWLPWAA